MRCRTIVGLALCLPTHFLVQPREASAQTPRRVALVGGTLIDGYGGRPIRNSVILVEGDRIKAIGTVGTVAVPRDAQVISTEKLWRLWKPSRIC